MHAKLAGHLSLHDMIKSVIDDARVKVASDEGEKKDEKSDKVKKLLKYEKKEHGHIPSEKEEEAEKKASADFDLSDSDDVEKLASALELIGEKIAADSHYLGGESHQGGETLATMSAVSGKQPYKKDSSKAHNVPMSTGLETKKETGPAKTAVPDTQHGGHIPVTAAMPKKGVMKTAAEGVMAKIEAMKGKKEEKKEDKGEEKGEKKENPFAKKEEKGEDKEKKSAALDFVLSKLGEGEQERRMGGETLDSKSGDGPKPESGSKGGNSARSAISSNSSAINMKKVDGKGPQKKMLSEVLTEPALSKSHDSKVSENLRNASKGGVKIAAAKDFLQKIAEEGCTCSGKGECKHCKLKEAMKKKMEKKSMGGMSMGGAAPAMTTPPPAMGR